VTALTWDATGTRKYETGIDKGVLYIPTDGVYDIGYAWSGLTAVTESPEGAELTALYADNIKYLNLQSVENFKGTIEAYTYPEEFEQCDGSAGPESGITVGQQTRKTFGLCYRSLIGNDTLTTDYGYKLHLVYGCLAMPSEKAYNTVNDSPEANTFSWEFDTTPVAIPGTNPLTGKAYKPSATIVIDSTKVDADALADLEERLYGTIATDPDLPTPEEVFAFFAGTVTEVTPGVPTYNSSTDIITIPSTTGVVYRVNGVIVPSGAFGPIAANKLVTAKPAVGYKFAPLVADEWLITFA
jgi:hypothetical protein